MLGTAVIIGLTALAGSWIAIPSAQDDDTAEAEAPSDADDLFWQDIADIDISDDADAGDEDAEPEPVRVGAGETLDNFDPEAGPLALVAPEGFDIGQVDIEMHYDPHFHETAITATDTGGNSFQTVVTGVEPDAFGPENLSVVA